MPIAWRDSNNDAQRFGDFGGMTASLPYLRSLGVTALWMTPIFPSPAYHGYQHGRADQLNPWFGNEAQFLSFVQAAHAESLKVFIDFVAYHVSHDTPYYSQSFGNPASPYTPWLAYTNASNTTYDGGVYTTWNGSSVGQIRWINSNPAVASTLKAWTARWLDPNGDGDPSDGIDGYRLDRHWLRLRLRQRWRRDHVQRIGRHGRDILDRPWLGLVWIVLRLLDGNQPLQHVREGIAQSKASSSHLQHPLRVRLPRPLLAP